MKCVKEHANNWSTWNLEWKYIYISFDDILNFFLFDPFICISWGWETTPLKTKTKLPSVLTTSSTSSLSSSTFTCQLWTPQRCIKMLGHSFKKVDQIKLPCFLVATCALFSKVERPRKLFSILCGCGFSTGLLDQGHEQLKEAAYLFSRVSDDLHPESCHCYSLLARVAYLQGKTAEVGVQLRTCLQKQEDRHIGR